MSYRFDWTAAACNTPTVLRMLPDLTPSTLESRRDRGLTRRSDQQGPRRLWHADEIAELAFAASLMRLGFSTVEADSVWQTAGRLVLDRRINPEPGQVPGVCLGIWRQPDGVIGITPYRTACGSEIDPDVSPMLAAAQAAGRPIISMELDSLFDAVEHSIRLLAPDCAAVAAARRPAHAS